MSIIRNLWDRVGQTLDQIFESLLQVLTAASNVIHLGESSPKPVEKKEKVVEYKHYDFWVLDLVLDDLHKRILALEKKEENKE